MSPDIYRFFCPRKSNKPTEAKTVTHVRMCEYMLFNKKKPQRKNRQVFIDFAIYRKIFTSFSTILSVCKKVTLKPAQRYLHMSFGLVFFVVCFQANSFQIVCKTTKKNKGKSKDCQIFYFLFSTVEVNGHIVNGINVSLLFGCLRIANKRLRPLLKRGG